MALYKVLQLTILLWSTKVQTLKFKFHNYRANYFQKKMFMDLSNKKLIILQTHRLNFRRK
jgi:hypothetical protein